MRLDQMPYPGTIPNGQKLRIEAMKAVNFLAVVAMNSGGSTSHAATVEAFFTACAQEAAKYKVTPP